MPPCVEVLSLVGGKLASVLDDYDAHDVRTLYTEDTRHMIPRTGSEAVSWVDDHIRVHSSYRMYHCTCNDCVSLFSLSLTPILKATRNTSSDWPLR